MYYDIQFLPVLLSGLVLWCPLAYTSTYSATIFSTSSSPPHFPHIQSISLEDFKLMLKYYKIPLKYWILTFKILCAIRGIQSQNYYFSYWYIQYRQCNSNSVGSYNMTCIHLITDRYIHPYIYIYIYVCVCVCVCVKYRTKLIRAQNLHTHVYSHTWINVHNYLISNSNVCLFLQQNFRGQDDFLNENDYLVIY